MDSMNILRAFPLLSSISQTDLTALSSLLQARHFSQGENIITEGEDSDDMYLLIKGTVDIVKKTVFGDTFVVATIDDSMHSVFGEMALLDHDKRSSTVNARTDCETLCIDRVSFDRFCQEHPEGGVKLLRFIGVNLVRNIRKENENLKMVYQALIEEIEQS